MPEDLQFMKNSSLPKDIIKIVSKAIKNRIYGSVEIYFEAGNITQITHRIINKIQHKTSPKIKEVKVTKHTKTSAQAIDLVLPQQKSL